MRRFIAELPAGLCRAGRSHFHKLHSALTILKISFSVLVVFSPPRPVAWKKWNKNFRVTTFCFLLLMMSFFWFVAIAVVYAHKEVVCVWIPSAHKQRLALYEGEQTAGPLIALGWMSLCSRSERCWTRGIRIPSLSLYGFLFFSFFSSSSRASRAAKRICYVASARQFEQ